MATAEVPIETDGNAIRQREILSRCFSEAIRRLDERQRQLSLQLEQKLRENQVHKKKLETDRLQLELTTEHIQSNLSSNSLQETGSEAISVFEQRIYKLKEEEKRIQFEWSPEQLYSEISKIGEVSLLPAFPQVDSDSNNCKRIKLDLVQEPSIQTQKQVMQPLLKQTFFKGEKWYLIDVSWFNKWKLYVSFDSRNSFGSRADVVVKPGPIDNTALLENGILKKGLKETSYKLVPALAWDKLLAWYEITEDSVEIKRQVLSPIHSLIHSFYGYNLCKVEIDHLEVKISIYLDNSRIQSLFISRSDTIHSLDRKVRALYNIHPERPILMYKSRDLILDMGREIQEVGIYEGGRVEIEVQNVDGTWPRTKHKAKKRKLF